MQWNSNSLITISKLNMDIQTAQLTSTTTWLKNNSLNLIAISMGKLLCLNWLNNKTLLNFSLTKEILLEIMTRHIIQLINNPTLMNTFRKCSQSRAYKHNNSIQLIFKQLYLQCRTLTTRWEEWVLLVITDSLILKETKMQNNSQCSRVIITPLNLQ